MVGTCLLSVAKVRQCMRPIQAVWNVHTSFVLAHGNIANLPDTKVYYNAPEDILFYIFEKEAMMQEV